MADHAVARHQPSQSFIRKYVFSTDHKVIGIQYLYLSLFAVSVGMILSVFMRLRLAWPLEKWPLLERIFPTGFAGGPMTPEFYLSMLTMHGTIMVFFVLTTAPLSGFGNYFLPIQIGARDMAFPVLNMLSFWVTLVAFFVMMAALFATGGAPLAGWTAYAPLSALGEVAGPGAGAGANALDYQHRHILRGVAADGAELPHHHHQSARAGHVPDADAPDRVGMVHHRYPGAARFSGAARRGRYAAARPRRRYQFLHSRGARCERSSHRSPGRFAHFVAAPLLVLRPPGGVYRHPSRDGRHVAHSLDLLPQAGLRLPRDGARDFRDRVHQLYRVGPPHVHERDESLLEHGVLDLHPGGRRTVGNQDLQLAGDVVGRAHSFRHAHAVRPRVRVPVCFRRRHRHAAGPARPGHLSA